MTGKAKNWKMDFTRVFCSRRWLLGVLMFPILDVLEVWTKAWYELSVFVATDWAANGNLSMLTPAVLTIAYAHSYCADLKNHFLRYHLIRSTLKEYVASKIVWCAIGSGVMIFMGRAISMLLFSMRYPWYYEDLGANSKLVVQMVSEGKLFLLIFVILLPMFLEGAFYGAMAFMISTWMPNSFVVAAIPIAVECVVINVIAAISDLFRYITPYLVYNWEYGIFVSIRANAIYAVCFTVIGIYGMFRISYRGVKRRLKNE